MFTRRYVAAAAILLLTIFTAPDVFPEPLTVHPTNPRYFTDGSGKAVYLTGSHTWANLVDIGTTDPPQVFDYNRYLTLLKENNHNFIRMWGRHVARYVNPDRYAQPLAWPRTGPPGDPALDGNPKFDLTQFDQTYFDRFRSRVMAARDQGIYVGIMLFGGKLECVEHWQGNPFNVNNNINGINGDPNGDGAGWETQIFSQIPSDVAIIQKAYVRKVIDTVNDLDNVLFEISNEAPSESPQWQYDLINYIKWYEATYKPKQHPLGMTAINSSPPNERDILNANPGKWVMYHYLVGGGADPNLDTTDPMVSDGTRVSIEDSDHSFSNVIYDNPSLGMDWVWKAFLRGHNPILMEYLFVQGAKGADRPLTDDDPGHGASRKAMGYTRSYANRMNLVAMSPRGDLTSTGYGLANPGVEYLFYQPGDGPFTVTTVAATYTFEWFNPATGTVVQTGTAVHNGGPRAVTPPFAGDAVLYYHQAKVPAPPIGLAIK